MNAKQLREAREVIPRIKDPEIRRTLNTVILQATDELFAEQTARAAEILRRRGKPELQWTPTRTRYERRLETDVHSTTSPPPNPDNGAT